jgi:hypothetical protein
MLQLGDSGGIEATGYSGNVTAGTGVNTNSTFFNLTRGLAAAAVAGGSAVLTLVDPATNTWSISSILAPNASSAATIGGGTKSLTEALTTVRISRTGTDTFDAGKINAIYEQ